MTIPLVYAQIFCGVVFFVILPIGLFLQHRADRKVSFEAAQATRELLEMAKGNGRKAKDARKALWLFYG